jgi:hypothetical protein
VLGRDHDLAGNRWVSSRRVLDLHYEDPAISVIVEIFRNQYSKKV